MSEPKKDQDQEKGDHVLKRMLKTPPKPHKSKDVGTPKQGDRDGNQKG